MKKTLTLITVLGITVLALAAVGSVYAHGPNPGTPQPDEPSPYGPGHMGGYGMMGWYDDESPMHDAMAAALADALELSVEELDARHEAGETLWEIAEAEGLSESEIQDLLLSAHDEALEYAVAEGWLTAEQAEWMAERMGQMWDGQYNHCGGGGVYEPRTGWRGMGW